MTQKEAFERWYYEVENYCLRAERMAIPFDDAEAAFDAGWQAATERAAKVQADPLPADAVKRIKDKCSALGLDDVAFAWHIQKHLAAAIRS